MDGLLVFLSPGNDDLAYILIHDTRTTAGAATLLRSLLPVLGLMRDVMAMVVGQGEDDDLPVCSAAAKAAH